MKKTTAIITLLFLICQILAGSISAAGRFQAKITYDGVEHDYEGANFTVLVNGNKVESPIPPLVLENGRSIVAVREIFESLGADVLWAEGNPGRAYICYDGNIVSLAINDDYALVNGKKVKMEVPAKIVAYNGIGKTMVPVRFVAETLGMEVGFDGTTDTISLRSVEPTPTPTPTPTRTPTPTPVQTPTPTPAGKYVASLSQTLGGDTLTVTLSLTATLDKYDLFTLDAPNRVVLDLIGFSAERLDASYLAGGNTARIRAGEYNGNARIVFDVTKIPQCKVSVADDKRSLVVTLTATGSSGTVSGPKVVIDAGHGGSDPGAIGYNADGSPALQEKDVTLPVAMELYNILRENGVDAYYTRNTDVYVTLAERADFANRIGASLFVSVHCNAFTTTDVQGSLVMHHISKDTSAYGVSGQDLATNILKYLPNALGTQNRGRVDGSAMYVIRKVDMPSVIVETAFITNASDRAKLADKTMQKKAAQAIAQGVLDTILKLTK